MARRPEPGQGGEHGIIHPEHVSIEVQAAERRMRRNEWKKSGLGAVVTEGHRGGLERVQLEQRDQLYRRAAKQQPVPLFDIAAQGSQRLLPGDPPQARLAVITPRHGEPFQRHFPAEAIDELSLPGRPERLGRGQSSASSRIASASGDSTSWGSCATINAILVSVASAGTLSPTRIAKTNSNAGYGRDGPCMGASRLVHQFQASPLIVACQIGNLKPAARSVSPSGADVAPPKEESALRR